jgi:hypothetical protein
MTTASKGRPAPHYPGVFEFTTPEAAEAEFHERLLASASGLPKICTIKRCRRRGRCLGPFDGDLPCKRRHLGLFQLRFGAALKLLGWSYDEEDADE